MEPFIHATLSPFESPHRSRRREPRELLLLLKRKRNWMKLKRKNAREKRDSKLQIVALSLHLQKKRRSNNLKQLFFISASLDCMVFFFFQEAEEIREIWCAEQVTPPSKAYVNFLALRFAISRSM